MTEPPALSYCTTCYNRFWQLKQVVKPNLNIINNSLNTEWIIVDFSGRDSEEMQKWLKENCPRSLAKGTLKYYQRTLPDFCWNVSTAKNVAHRLATGKILVNLDGDNFLQPNDPKIVRQIFQRNPKSVLHQTWNNFLIYHNLATQHRQRIEYAPYQEQYTGSNGRISLTKRFFTEIGGYDEEMLFMGFQDTDLLTRAVLHGLNYHVQPPQINNAPAPRTRTARTRVTRVYNNSLLRTTASTHNLTNYEIHTSLPIQRRRRPLTVRPIHVPPGVPYKGAGTDSVSNQRAKPYGNNQVKSWKEAERRNRFLSHRKIKAGKLQANVDGFQESLENYRRLLAPENEQNKVSTKTVNPIREKQSSTALETKQIVIPTCAWCQNHARVIRVDKSTESEEGIPMKEFK